MSRVIDELVADAGLSGDDSADLAAFLSDLEQLALVDAPRPSAELAALLASPPVRSSSRPKLRLVAAAGAAAAMGAMTVTGVAAAANELPEPAQQFVADLTERYLPDPLHFPRPIPDREPAEKPAKPPKQVDEPVVIVPPTTQPAVPIPDEGLPSTAPQRNGELLSPEPSPLPSETAAPSQTPAPSPTEPSASPSATAPAQPSESPAPSGSPEPTTTPSPSGTGTGDDPRIGGSTEPSPTGSPEAATQAPQP